LSHSVELYSGDLQWVTCRAVYRAPMHRSTVTGYVDRHHCHVAPSTLLVHIASLRTLRRPAVCLRPHQRSAVSPETNRRNVDTNSTQYKYRNISLFLLPFHGEQNSVYKVKVKADTALPGGNPTRATGRHLLYGITQCYLTADTGERVPPKLPNPNHRDWYSVYLPRRDGRLSWPSWLDDAPAGSRTSDLSITSPTPNRCTTKTSVWMYRSATGLAIKATANQVINYRNTRYRKTSNKRPRRLLEHEPWNQGVS